MEQSTSARRGWHARRVEHIRLLRCVRGRQARHGPTLGQSRLRNSLRQAGNKKAQKAVRLLRRVWGDFACAKWESKARRVSLRRACHPVGWAALSRRAARSPRPDQARECKQRHTLRFMAAEGYDLTCVTRIIVVPELPVHGRILNVAVNIQRR